MRKILIIGIILNCWFSFSQRSILDSIKFQVKTHHAEDTARAFFLNELAWQYLDYSLDSSEMYYNQGLILSTKLNYVNGIISAKNVKGLLFRITNQLDDAIKVGEEVVELRKKHGPQSKLTGAYTNLGSVYLVKNDYANALKYFNKGLENAEKLKQIENQLLILSNIGIVYNNSELNDLALETYQKALLLNKQLPIDVQLSQSAQLNANIATIYDKRGLFKEAFKYYKNAYDRYKKDGNIRLLSLVVKNLASSSRSLKNYKNAEFYINEMEVISKQLQEPEYTASYHSTKANILLATGKHDEALLEVNKGIALIDTVEFFQTFGILLAVKADCYESLHEYKKALEFSDKALVIFKQTTNKSEVASLYLSKARAYQAMKDYDKALFFYDKAVHLRDSINTEMYDTRIATLNSFNQLDKKEKELELSNNEREKISIENKRQTTLLIAGSIVGLLVVVLLVFSLRAYKVKQRDNVLLNSQKQEIEIKNIGLQESKKEIENQKNIVEEKQKEIVDSINYALQIQKTLIANHELVNQTIPDSFVFFKPKDIVSGDFYWATKKDNRFYLAVCDSTGHGVPGAFMSLLNINYLNEAIKEKNLIKPNEVFDHVRKRLIETISQNGRQDGMDGILICIEDNKNIITYAAANNAPVLVSNNKIVDLKMNKMPVGIGEKKEPFTEFSFEINKGDVLYLYTDGYADQFGGPKGKKFKYKQLDEILVSVNNLPVLEQENILIQKFTDWIGKLEQVDDVCVLGIKM